MNAYELADELEKAPYYTSYEPEAAEMLRQQAKRIEELEENLASLKHRYKALNWGEE